MSSTQKLIKNIALAFAFFLIVSIIGSIMFFYNLIGDIFFGEKNLLEEPNIIEVSNKTDNLTIEVATTNLTIKQGKEFKVETNSSYIEVKQKGNQLTIKEEAQGIFNTKRIADTIIYIPKDIKLENTYLETGAGVVKIEYLNTSKLDFKLGAGKVDIKNIIVLKKSKIAGGTGQLNIKDSTFTDTTLELGMGEVNVKSELLGNTKINCGIGSSNITIIGKEEDYQIDLTKGIGSAKINNKSIDSNKSYGNGDNLISINGGIGSINVNFQE